MLQTLETILIAIAMDAHGYHPETPAHPVATIGKRSATTRKTARIEIQAFLVPSSSGLRLVTSHITHSAFSPGVAKRRTSSPIYFALLCKSIDTQVLYCRQHAPLRTQQTLHGVNESL